MWLAQKMTQVPETAAHQLGVVTGMGENGVLVQSDTDYQLLPLAAPYGITAVPPTGAVAVVLAAGGDGSQDLCIGAKNEAVSIQPGELLLRSAGGASIYLKNNGDVVINGIVWQGV